MPFTISLRNSFFKGKSTHLNFYQWSINLQEYYECFYNHYNPKLMFGYIFIQPSVLKNLCVWRMFDGCDWKQNLKYISHFDQ
ncbi:hypothetical protein BLOT_012410 [Blomia tropicalis]|nr:hypothetical protein BLOT_012410 [Blomia tropicalis]